MKITKPSRVAIATSAILSAAAPAVAQTPPQAGVYAGFAAGSTRGTNLNEGEVNDALRALGYTNVTTTADKRDTGYRLNLGYQFNQNIAVEAIYTRLGEYSTRTTVSGGSVNANYKADGFGADLILFAPFDQQLSVYGRLGIFRATVDASFSAAGSFNLLFDQGTVKRDGEHFGVGVQYDITKQLGLRLEAERYRKLGGDDTGGDLHVDVYTLGAIFRF